MPPPASSSSSSSSSFPSPSFCCFSLDKIGANLSGVRTLALPHTRRDFGYFIGLLDASESSSSCPSLVLLLRSPKGKEAELPAQGTAPGPAEGQETACDAEGGAAPAAPEAAGEEGVEWRVLDVAIPSAIEKTESSSLVAVAVTSPSSPPATASSPSASSSSSLGGNGWVSFPLSFELLLCYSSGSCWLCSCVLASPSSCPVVLVSSLVTKSSTGEAVAAAFVDVGALPGETQRQPLQPGETDRAHAPTEETALQPQADPLKPPICILFSDGEFLLWARAAKPIVLTERLSENVMSVSLSPLVASSAPSGSSPPSSSSSSSSSSASWKLSGCISGRDRSLVVLAFSFSPAGGFERVGASRKVEAFRKIRGDDSTRSLQCAWHSGGRYLAIPGLTFLRLLQPPNFFLNEAKQLMQLTQKNKLDSVSTPTLTNPKLKEQLLTL
eukprot:GHVT01076970.1.p1 GENE.GHVT01076970.1~~GHVT01076970.1.p1  ORF type:complete len:441 (-),score=143.35 GHVT01076970.1:101-1423(-)